MGPTRHAAPDASLPGHPDGHLDRAVLLLAIIWPPGISPARSTFTAGGLFPESVADPERWRSCWRCSRSAPARRRLMPFHRWLPAAMVAPTPVSALLHAVAVVKTGVFTILKIAVYVFGPARLVQTGEGLGVADLGSRPSRHRLAASLIALTKDNLKARLAYSTISQLSYIVLGAALGHAPHGRPRRRHAHRDARRRQDHAVLLRRRDLRRGAQDRDQRHARHRPHHAGHDVRLPAWAR